MGQQPNKFHISDDGKIFQIQKDGSITEKGQIDVLLNQSSSNPKPNVKYFLTKNYIWLCVFGGVLLSLLIIVFGEERFYYYGLADSIHVFFFDSTCWIYLLTLCCVFGTWVMHKKQANRIMWIYAVYGMGVSSMTVAGGIYNYDILSFVILGATCAIWAYAIQNSKNK